MKKVHGWAVPEFDRIISKQCKNFPQTDYQQTILDWALSRTYKFDLAIDIGANIGLHSVRFSNKFKNVFSFEPYSINYECLLENTKMFNNIHIYKTGLGAENKDVEICLPTDSDNSGAPSIIDFSESLRNINKEIIKIEKLDSYILKPDLIKIDVQSYELEVLKGAQETLKKYQPVLIIEVGKGEPLRQIVEFLKQFNYIMDGITNKDKGFYVPKKEHNHAN
jgi:FkbM family methyltransferase